MVRRMGRLLLIRHGQAAAFTEDSDRLTELGVRQARTLGEQFVAEKLQIDLVVKGSFRPVIDRKYPLHNIADAYRYVATGEKIGNVIIMMDD